MKINIFHGSKKVIRKPTFGSGKRHNDYGLGFYCTEDYDLAGEWAVSSSSDGYINEYCIDTAKLTLLDLNSKEYCILDWLEILLENRKFDIQSDFGNEAIGFLRKNFGPNIEGYDLITGYRADDSYFSFAQDFLNNIISLSTLNQAMRIGDLGEQIVLKSRYSFENLQFIDAYKVESSKYYPSKETRDTKARESYKMLRQRPWKKGEIYLMNIIDKELTRNDLFL